MNAHTETLVTRGYSLAITSPATGTVREDWPALTYRVRLDKAGKAIWEGEYHLGIGHAKQPKSIPLGLPERFCSVFYCYKRNPGALLKDKQLAADYAEWMARHQKVAPDLAGVLHSLIMDGSAFFDAVSFEDWCREYGYDADSRKAHAIWQACGETGRTLTRALGSEEIAYLRDLFSNY